MKVIVVTKIPSPYQVELFNALAARHDIELRVLYVRRGDSDRKWKPRTLEHIAGFLEDARCDGQPELEQSDLVVFSWYQSDKVKALIERRAGSGRPWSFWAEPPGFRSKGLLGRAYRRWHLRHLARDRRVSIWGIGHWAVEGWRREFGSARHYFHVPYVSQLSRFFQISKASDRSRRTLLFSGSLIERKGILELCEAFAMIAQAHPSWTLRVVGSGDLEPSLHKMYGRHRQIEFKGFQDWDELADSYRGAEVLCAPSRYDGWGLVVPEAMASAMPVIASTDMGAARELVAPGRTGWLVAPRDVNGLRETLSTALALAPEVLAALGQRGRELAGAYDVPAGVERFETAAARSLHDWSHA
jgi:glycosyltransferase involved in cell wall biosynthesis